MSCSDVSNVIEIVMGGCCDVVGVILFVKGFGFGGVVVCQGVLGLLEWGLEMKLEVIRQWMRVGVGIDLGVFDRYDVWC